MPTPTIISRKDAGANKAEAKTQGLMTYQGTPCEYGHTEKYVTYGACVQCHAEKRYKNNESATFKNETDYPITAEEITLLHRGGVARGRQELTRKLQALGIKFCGGCSILFNHSEFNDDPTKWDKLQGACKRCQSERASTWNKNNIGKSQASSRRYDRKDRQKNPKKKMLKSAKDTGTPYNLTEDGMVWNTICPIFEEWELEYGVPGPRTDSSASIDALFPKFGHILGATIVCSWLANRLKNDSTLLEMWQISFMPKHLLEGGQYQRGPEHPDARALAKGMYKGATNRQTKRGGPELTWKPEDLFIPVTCPYIHIPLIKGEGYPWDNSPTLDRIDNSLGYENLSNLIVCSWRANYLKSNGTIDQMIRLYTGYDLIMRDPWTIRPVPAFDSEISYTETVIAETAEQVAKQWADEQMFMLIENLISHPHTRTAR